MNKIIIAKRNSAIFLAIVLVAGIIALSSPSFMITSTQATSDHEKDNDDDDRKSYEKDRDKDENDESSANDYGNDDKKDYDKKSYEKENYYKLQYKSSYKQDYKPTEYSPYGKDNNNIYKSKESNVNLKKINCNNINVNINGGSGLNTRVIHESLGTLLPSQASKIEEVRDTHIGTTTFGNGEKRFGSYDDWRKDFVYKCVNNNDNKQLIPPTPTPTPTPTDNNVYVVWADNTPGNSDIFFAASNDNGQTFSSPPDNLSENTGFSSSPQISSNTS